MNQVRRIFRADAYQERRDVAIRIRPVVFTKVRVDGGREVDEDRTFRPPLHEDVVEVEVAVNTVRMAMQLLERGSDRPERAVKLRAREPVERAIAEQTSHLLPAVEILVVDPQVALVGVEHLRDTQPSRPARRGPRAQRVAQRRAKDPFLGESLAETAMICRGPING